jgi:hypothetical protein
MLTFNKKYFILTVVLFLIEVLIALYVRDQFIRPYFGDFLVVILLYCFVKSFLNLGVINPALIVLVFSYVIETLQYFHWLQHMGLEKSKIARVIMGSSFAWNDIVAYTLGIVFVIGVEKYLQTGEKTVYPVNTRN